MNNTEYIIDNVDKAISELVFNKWRLQKAYNYYNGKRDPEQFRYLEENFGIGNPTSMDFTPLLKKHIDYLVGEYLELPLLPKISCKDQATLSSINRDLQLQVSTQIFKYLQSKLNNYFVQGLYKDNINIMLNAYSKIKDKLGSNNFDGNIPHTILEEDNKAVDESEFKEKFDNVVDNYIYGNIGIDEFIDNAKETIMNYYPKELLYNKMEFDTNIANDVINGVVHRMLETDGCIMFAVSMDNNDEWKIKDFVYEGEDANTSTQNIFVLANDFKGYIDSLYPELESDGKCFPKYRFNIITISKRKEKESDDNE